VKADGRTAIRLPPPVNKANKAVESSRTHTHTHTHTHTENCNY